MKIAKDINNAPVECVGSTPGDGTYYCFICGERAYPCNDLKKENGRKKDYYFAHYRDNCSGNVESYLHHLAKVIIAGASQIALPDRRFSYELAEVECAVDSSLRPDVLLDKEIAIEICFSNPKTETHVQLFRELNLSAVEIELYGLTIESGLEDIRYAVLDDKRNRHYLFSATQSKQVEESHSPNPIVVIVLMVLAFIGLKKFVQWLRS